jgi:crossover junction endodeoxyribonuclease RuvC
MTRILGIDPGSNVAGFGVVDSDGSRLAYVASGCLRLPPGGLPQRLKVLFEEMNELIRRYTPDTLAVEDIFVQKNAASALKLGHARGTILCAGASAGLSIAEYPTAQVKLAITGSGRAEKIQVQHMVKVLLGIRGRLQADAADALAVAACHAHLGQTLARSGLTLRGRR